MATTKSSSDLKALQDRVAELENQLRELKAQMNGRPDSARHWPDVPMTEEEAQAFHESSEWVQEYIRKEREKDLKRVNAAIDRQEERERKAAAQKGKSTKTASRRRRAG